MYAVQQALAASAFGTDDGRTGLEITAVLVPRRHQ